MDAKKTDDGPENGNYRWRDLRTPDAYPSEAEFHA